MANLRGENGCNWDKKQTHESLIPFLLEETYEVVDAIYKKDFLHLKEELGDLLFNIYFQARIAEEEKHFSINDVAKEVSDKLVRRHPHVFETKKNISPEEVRKNWEAIKKEEKKAKKTDQALLLDAVPSTFPSLLLAEKLQEKASHVGFDWSDISGPEEKLKEELEELQVELKNYKETGTGQNKLEDEFGDVLFSLVNLARFCKISPEKALLGACKKFRDRFNYIEEQSQQMNQSLEEMSLEEMDKLWNEAKKKGIA
ncbi:MAG: nucleoside triphosphate pyrophosphohydrolase [Leptospiraceae bacterium]|nr:nucleoside triphosphate pyrophosphohydrolase [Leptospiraceae bacterium]MCP5499359.1 nucleoside triphosphate pyrophosphohydrolase [Leptospiraceae bacterium]